MKKIAIILIGITLLLSLTQCETPISDVALRNSETRSKLISSLINNEEYMTELMDSMKKIHPEELLSSINIIISENPHLRMKMVNNMMEVSEEDSTMCAMVMDKTMEMCNADAGKCEMMSNAMKNHQGSMECIMNNTSQNKMMNHIGEPEKQGKPEDHLKHH